MKLSFITIRFYMLWVYYSQDKFTYIYIILLYSSCLYKLSLKSRCSAFWFFCRSLFSFSILTFDSPAVDISNSKKYFCITIFLYDDITLSSVWLYAIILTITWFMERIYKFRPQFVYFPSMERNNTLLIVYTLKEMKRF